VQLYNAALAVAAVDAANLGIGLPVQQIGLAGVKWPGRFQQVAPDLVLDGAHNPAAAEVLVRTWEEVFPGERATLIFGVLDDKDVAGLLTALAPLAAEVVLTAVSSPRAVPTARLREMAHALLPALPCIEVSNVEAALARPSKGRRLVAGSLYLVGEVLSAHAGRKQERSAQ
jgi:dihydrofolate synthase/folylpolyglutamate synthase